MSLTATVVITTKDRVSDLENALESCVIQTALPEVIVIDDASADGTCEMVREKFPDVRLIVHPKPTGYIVGRNEAAQLATGDVIFSIDDDAVFTTEHVVQQVLDHFSEPAIGAVAIPFVDVNRSPEVFQKAPDAECVWLADRYIGTAHAVRKNLFLELGGYRVCYFHQGEERDFCLRLLASGHFVRVADCDVIHHFESPKRDHRRMDQFGRRNDILFASLNVPLSRLPVQLAGTSLKGLAYGFKVGRAWQMIQGVIKGYLAMFRYWSERAPVCPSAIQKIRRLQHDGPLRLDEIVGFEDTSQDQFQA